MSKVDLSVTASKVEVSPGNYKTMNVELSYVNDEELMSVLSVEDVVNYFGNKELLDEIGEEAVRLHFGIGDDQ